MNILIPDNWLRDFLKTKAKPTDIARCLSLCGPSVEKIEKGKTGPIYSIEVTTNRVDSASVLGIAREAAAILPRFGYTTKLILPQLQQPITPNKNLPLKIETKPSLTKRVTAVVLNNIKNRKSPQWIRDRLESAGIRSLDAVVDITNYVMLEIGHPTHVFDYDLINTHQLIFRESKKGEQVTTLDNKTYVLTGNDIVIDDGTNRIIDLPGIMGTKNSAVYPNTKRIIYFLDNNNPHHIRNTSMSLGIRTAAATLNEKGVDPELCKLAILKGLQLYQELCEATLASKVYDIYPAPYKEKVISLTADFIEDQLGVQLPKQQTSKSLTTLGFGVSWNGNNLTVSVPSLRANDVNIQEDVIEEIARIYGYHNLPSQLMTGTLPEKLETSTFDFERKLKELIHNLGGVEVYTSSLVPKDMVSLQGYTPRALRLKNPLGTDTEYLRMSLAPSLVQTADRNQKELPFHLFEVANIYIARKNNLPREKLTLAGILANPSFRQSKGTVEQLLEALNIKAKYEVENSVGFLPNHRLSINHGRQNLGEFGILESGYAYYEFDIEKLAKFTNVHSHKPLPKYPPQVEDITLIIPSKTYIAKVIQTIKNTDKNINSVELVNVYQNSKTFRISYQDPNKTLTNKQVQTIRKKVLTKIKKRFTAKLKE